MALRHAIFVKCSEHCDDPHMVDIFFGLAYGLMPFWVTEDTNQGTLYFRRSFGPTEKDKVCPFVFVRLFFCHVLQAQRTAAANEELSAHPVVQWYNAGAASRTWTDHLQTTGPLQRVAWSIERRVDARTMLCFCTSVRIHIYICLCTYMYTSGCGPLFFFLMMSRSVQVSARNKNSVESHLRVVPALIGWTKWERDAPCATMRRRLQTEAVVAAGTTASPVTLRQLRLAQALDFVGMKAVADGRSDAQLVDAVRNAATTLAGGRRLCTVMTVRSSM